MPKGCFKIVKIQQVVNFFAKFPTQYLFSVLFSTNHAIYKTVSSIDKDKFSVFFFDFNNFLIKNTTKIRTKNIHPRITSLYYYPIVFRHRVVNQIFMYFSPSENHIYSFSDTFSDSKL